MGLWRCFPAWALSSDSHGTCLPRRCLPVFLIKPSSHTSPGSGVWVESARTPAGIRGNRRLKTKCPQSHLLLFWQYDPPSLRLKHFYWVTTGSQLLKSMALVWLYTQTDLSSSQDVVPDWSASKVNVEICEAALHTHETVPERSGGRTENTMWMLD